jgi:sulfide:quinone oxidoreductase
MKKRVVVLGAGFGGLEFCTRLSETLGEDIDVTLIDKGDAFVFGYSKLDVMFGFTTLDAVRLPYRDFVKPGVRFRQETIAAIDPANRRVTTNAATYDADVLVVALGADYDVDATPGLAEDGNEFYSVAGAARARELLPKIREGRILVGICGSPYKCPPAPSEAVLLLHDYLATRGVRAACEITLASPLATPVPPSPDTSRALLEAFAERDITYVGDRDVISLDPSRKIATLEDQTALTYDLFLGVPKHRAPDVVQASGLAVDGFIPVSSKTLETAFPGVYAFGDCAKQGTPKAGMFAEGAARAVAGAVIASLRSGEPAVPHTGTGACYIEFGAGRVGRVDVDFLSGPEPTGTYYAPSLELRAGKEHFGASRRARWFGR